MGQSSGPKPGGSHDRRRNFGLLLVFGCGGDGSGSPPDPPPNTSGLWTGTETVVDRGGSECNPGTETGTRTGEMFNVTQDEEAGDVSANGLFQTSGTIAPATIRITGQVTGDNMTAEKRVVGVDCGRIAHYDLTR